MSLSNQNEKTMLQEQEIFVALSDEAVISYIGCKKGSEWRVWEITTQDDATLFMNELRHIDACLGGVLIDRLKQKKVTLWKKDRFLKLINTMTLSDEGFYFKREDLESIDIAYQVEPASKENHTFADIKRNSIITFEEFDKVLVLETQKYKGREFILVNGVASDEKSITPLVKFMEVFHESNCIEIKTIEDNELIESLKTVFRDNRVKGVTNMAELSEDIREAIGWAEPLIKWQTRNDLNQITPYDFNGVRFWGNSSHSDISNKDYYYYSIELLINYPADLVLRSFNDRQLVDSHYEYSQNQEFFEDVQPFIDLYGIRDYASNYSVIGYPGMEMKFDSPEKVTVFLSELEKELKRRFPQCKSIEVHIPHYEPKKAGVKGLFNRLFDI